jgi:polysaccharide export outer membrane protein
MLKMLRPLAIGLVFGLVGSNLVVAAGSRDQSKAGNGRKLTTSDVLQINVLNQSDLNTLARIEPDGTLKFPYLGRIKAAGMTEDRLINTIAKGLADKNIVTDPQVFIELQTFGQQVSILGSVGSPGAFTLDRPTTISQALARAGGIREDAGAGSVLLRRNGTVVARYNAKDILAGKMPDRYVENNDELYVEQGSTYYLYGFVNRPGEFPLSRSYSVQQAIAAGGGLAPLGSEWRIQIRRRLPDGQVSEQPASLDDEVQPNDTIVVNERIF